MLDGPIRRREPALSFEELAELRELGQQILEGAVRSLSNYRDQESGGFYHVLSQDADDNNPAGDFSKASSATVIPFLVRTGRWNETVDADPVDKGIYLASKVLTGGKWTSSNLDPDNVFTVGFLLELISALHEIKVELTDAQKRICRAKLKILRGLLDAGNGRVGVPNEAPNSYLTHLCTRALLDWDTRLPEKGGRRIDQDLWSKVWDQAMATVYREISLATAEPGAADVFELGYAVLLANQFGQEQLRPDERRTLRFGIHLFFEAQKDDGTWPRGRRLFSYPNYGNAYCYEFEFLVQLLTAFSDSHVLLPYLGKLKLAMHHLTDEAVALPRGGYGWASGHHRQLKFPESWSTASCFHVTHLLDRLVAEAVTDTILADLGEPRLRVTAAPSWDKFEQILDSPVKLPDGRVESAKRVLRERLVQPLLDQRTELAEGKELEAGTPLSAILYGPPGTSKTNYANAIASALGWQLIGIDPSILLRRGFDQLQSETNQLFYMLRYAERVVVFFDEIDELVRDRLGKTEEATSRFLTTSMLPRIMRLRKSRRVIFLVATNHLEVFDAAIARPGRFDLVLPIMPPTMEAKLSTEKWASIKSKMVGWKIENQIPIRDQMSGLTYDEFGLIASRLQAATTADAFKAILKEAANAGTLKQKADGDKVWSTLIEGEVNRIRLGG